MSSDAEMNLDNTSSLSSGRRRLPKNSYKEVDEDDGGDYLGKAKKSFARGRRRGEGRGRGRGSTSSKVSTPSKEGGCPEKQPSKHRNEVEKKQQKKGIGKPSPRKRIYKEDSESEDWESEQAVIRKQSGRPHRVSQSDDEELKPCYQVKKPREYDGPSELVEDGTPTPKFRSKNDMLVKDGNKDVEVPEGWNRVVLMRTVVKYPGAFDVYYQSPSGKKLRSKVQVEKHCEKNGLEIDLSILKFNHKANDTDASLVLPKVGNDTVADHIRGLEDYIKEISEASFRNMDIEIDPKIADHSNFPQTSLIQILNEEIEVKREAVESENTKVFKKEIEQNELIKKVKDDNEETDSSYIEKIRKALDLEIARPGNFACGGVLKKAQLELIVTGLGKIKLPLSSEQGIILKAKSTAAPFGRGTKTLVHKSVRDAWQVEAEDVTLNDEFNNLIKLKMVEIIAYLMGESNIEVQQKSLKENHEVELYKLVYYEKGGHFSAHRDTEKAPGMLATLVIQLPAGHKGGALVVRHKGETTEFNFENDSGENYFYTAFFADCEHKLEKITAGHRLVLIYNIIRKTPHLNLNPYNDCKSISYKNFMTTIKKSLEEWKCDTKGPKYVVYKLDHLYTDTNLSFQNLKGSDKKIADALRSYSDIKVYLATVTKVETRRGYDDGPYCSGYNNEPDLISDDEDEDRDCSYTLSNWIGVNNYLVPFGKRTLNENEIMEDKDIFDEDDEYCNRGKIKYTGNAGCTVEYTYKKTAIVFCPKSHEILIACESNFSSVIIECKNLSEGKIEDALEMFNGIMLYIVKDHDKAMMQLRTGDDVANIMEIMSLFEKKTKSCLANTFLQALLKPFNSSHYGISTEIVGLKTIHSAIALANIIDKLSWDTLGTSVLLLAKKSAVHYTLGCAQLVSSMLSLELIAEAILIVEVATSQIIINIDTLRSDYWALWTGLLASYDFFSPCFDKIVEQISEMRADVMIEIIAEIHRTLQPNIINQYKIENIFQNFLNILQSNGWKKLSVKSVTFICPVVLFVNKLGPDFSPLNSFVQAVIEQENSRNFLEPILKLPKVVAEKDNPAIQLMVQERLEQIENICPSVFSWSQPNATLVNRPTYNRGPNSGPETKDLHNFLRSGIQTKSFRGFGNKRQADSFGAKYFSNGNYNHAGEYSAMHQVSGRGQTVECKIIKTRNYFDEQLKKYNLLCTEAKALRNRYCGTKKTVAQKRALKS